MSLYGNVKKIGSSSFQFDRVYPNRVAMEAAKTTDGVYAGRYVLIEYGPRFNDVEAGDTVEYTGQPNQYEKIENNINGEVERVRVSEQQSFVDNVNTDLRAFGAVYDSTVWQKIFVGNAEKYVMVAELNAMAPKLDITQDSPLTYKTGDRITDYTKGIVTGKVSDQGSLTETVRLINAEEIYNKPYFDTAIDTELSYLMHYPTTLNLEIDNNTVNFHEKGFNMAYSYGEDNGVSSIAWVPKGLDQYTYAYEDGYEGDENHILHDFNGNPLALLSPNTKKDIDTKMLFMSFPALGNAMNALYNLLYGRPDSDADLSEGALRPYFLQFLKGIEQTNFLQVFDPSVNKNVYVTINDDEGHPTDNKFTITGKLIDDETGQANIIVPIFLEVEQIPKTFTPDFVISAYRDLSNNTYIPYADASATQKTDYTNWVLYNTLTGEPVPHKFHIPTGNEDPDMTWMENVPALSDILANNTAGLATILSSLFGDTDPLTGTIRYYLYNDWLAKETPDSSGPYIYNKPEVVGGYPTTFIVVESGQEKLDDSPFETAGFFPNLGEDGNTIPRILYPHTEIQTSEDFSGGHYSVDFTTWQLVENVKIKINQGIGD